MQRLDPENYILLALFYYLFLRIDVFFYLNVRRLQVIYILVFKQLDDLLIFCCSLFVLRPINVIAVITPQ